MNGHAAVDIFQPVPSPLECKSDILEEFKTIAKYL